MEEVQRPIRILWSERQKAPHSVMGWTVALALLLHWGVLRLPISVTILNPTAENDSKAPIVLDSVPDETRKPVVSTSEAMEQTDSTEPAPFNSDVRNRVKKQTRAPVIGKFREGYLKKGEGGSSVDSQTSGIPEGGEGEAGSKLGMHDLMSFARTPHALPKEIPEGGQTLLNTDKVLYASFINRIAEEIYDPWVEYGQSAIKEAMSRGKKIEATTYITKLNVVMNSAGEVVAMTVLDSCKLDELDDAPKKAFWRIARFPNPPPQLTDGDGFLRLTYEFHFEWKTSGFNIVPWQI